MKKPLALLAVSAATALTLQGTVLAHPAAASGWKYQTKRITFNNRTVSAPAGIAATDPASKHLTTYMPIYYVMKALEAVGIRSQWNGHTWTMTVDSSRLPGGKVAASNVSNNQVVIVINGVKVASSARIVAPDPASHKNTTYVPVWYVMQALKALNVASDWDGQTWSMVDLKPLSDGLKVSQTAVPQHDSLDLTMHMHANLTAQGLKDAGNDPNAMDDDLELVASALLGYVGSDKVADIQETFKSGADTETVRIYAQGSHVYEQDNGGAWQDISDQTSLNDVWQLSTQDEEFHIQQLSHVKVTVGTNTLTFTGNVDFSSISPDLLQTALLGLVGSDASGGDTQKFLQEVLRQTTGTVTYTLTKTSAGWAATAENATLHIHLPTSLVPNSSDMQQEVSSFDITESVKVQVSYQGVEIQPPSGLPGTSSSSGDSGTGGAAGNGTTGTGSATGDTGTSGASSGNGAS